MQKKYWVLIGLNLMVHLILNWGFFEGQSMETITHYATAVTTSNADVILPAKQNQANMAYAILVMPKSYLPLLEKFKHRKIAKDIKIFPANIGWDQGRMIALPKKAIYKGGGHPMKRVVNEFRETQVIVEKPLTSETRMARGAAALFF